jgi:hypothetical protein
VPHDSRASVDMLINTKRGQNNVKARNSKSGIDKGREMINNGSKINLREKGIFIYYFYLHCIGDC